MTEYKVMLVEVLPPDTLVVGATLYNQLKNIKSVSHDDTLPPANILGFNGTTFVLNVNIPENFICCGSNAYNTMKSNEVFNDQNREIGIAN